MQRISLCLPQYYFRACQKLACMKKTNFSVPVKAYKSSSSKRKYQIRRTYWNKLFFQTYYMGGKKRIWSNHHSDKWKAFSLCFSLLRYFYAYINMSKHQFQAERQWSFGGSPTTTSFQDVLDAFFPHAISDPTMFKFISQIT